MFVREPNSNPRCERRSPGEERHDRHFCQEDLLVPFPSAMNKDLMEGRLSDILHIRRLRSRTLQGIKGDSVDFTKSKKNDKDGHLQLSESCLLRGDSDESTCFDNNISSPPTSGHFLDPISVVTVVGDTDEFKKLQEALRGSRMVTTGGAHAMLNTYIHSHRANVEARQAENTEWAKIKCAPVTMTNTSRTRAISPLRQRLMSSASRWKTTQFSSSTQLLSSSSDDGIHDKRYTMRRCFSERLNQMRTNNIN